MPIFFRPENRQAWGHAWRNCHRWWSVRIGIVGVVLMAAIPALNDQWPNLAPSLLYWFPHKGQQWIPIGGVIVAIITHVIQSQDVLSQISARMAQEQQQSQSQTQTQQDTQAVQATNTATDTNTTTVVVNVAPPTAAAAPTTQPVAAAVSPQPITAPAATVMTPASQAPTTPPQTPTNG
jgi:hypothetical protein